MRIIGTASVIACVAACAAPSNVPSHGNAAVDDFENYVIGQPPKGFTVALTGGGKLSSWVIQEDGQAASGKKSLAQTSQDPTNARYPLCVLDSVTAKDVTVSVKLKPVSGRVDQAGGVVLRYQDADNYYIARANALEGNVRLYRVVDGQRVQFASADAEVKTGQWHTLTLTVQGSHFWVSFDGKPLFEADDDAIAKEGKVGMWTKADSVTMFDDFTVSHEQGLKE